MTLTGSTSFALTISMSTHCSDLRQQLVDRLVQHKREAGETVDEQDVNSKLKLIHKGKPLDLIGLGASPVGEYLEDGDKVHIVLK